MGECRTFDSCTPAPRCAGRPTQHQPEVCTSAQPLRRRVVECTECVDITRRAPASAEICNARHFRSNSISITIRRGDLGSQLAAYITRHPAGNLPLRQLSSFAPSGFQFQSSFKDTTYHPFAGIRDNDVGFIGRRYAAQRPWVRPSVEQEIADHGLGGIWKPGLLESCQVDPLPRLSSGSGQASARPR